MLTIIDKKYIYETKSNDNYKKEKVKKIIRAGAGYILYKIKIYIYLFAFDERNNFIRNHKNV